MSDEAVRKEFEAWAKTKPYLRVSINSWMGGCYQDGEAQTGWNAWQASRSAAIQECADLVDESISDVPTWPLRDAILALKER